MSPNLTALYLFYNKFSYHHKIPTLYHTHINHYTLTYIKIYNKYIPLIIKNNFKNLPQPEITPIFTIQNDFPQYKTKQQMISDIKLFLTI